MDFVAGVDGCLVGGVESEEVDCLEGSLGELDEFIAVNVSTSKIEDVLWLIQLIFQKQNQNQIQKWQHQE